MSQKATVPVSVPVPAPQPKKAEAGLPYLSAAQSFWLLLALHGVLISGEIYLAYRHSL